MSDVELIRYLRAVANYGTCLTANDKEALALAADRLEDLDERVAIMMEPASSGPSGHLPR